MLNVHLASIPAVETFSDLQNVESVHLFPLSSSCSFPPSFFKHPGGGNARRGQLFFKLLHNVMQRVDASRRSCVKGHHFRSTSAERAGLPNDASSRIKKKGLRDVISEDWTKTRGIILLVGFIVLGFIGDLWGWTYRGFIR